MSIEQEKDLATAKIIITTRSIGKLKSVHMASLTEVWKWRESRTKTNMNGARENCDYQSLF